MSGFPELVRQYRISSVPKTAVGERGVEYVGAGAEGTLLQHVLEAARRESGGLAS